MSAAATERAGFFRGLMAARAHLGFLVGLGAAMALIWQVERSVPPPVAPGVEDFARLLETGEASGPKRRPTSVPLTAEEQAWARTAWRYFENNHVPATGLVNSVDRYPSTTLWDLGSYWMALLAARDLGLIDAPVFEARMEQLLGGLSRMALVDGRLPNKAYNTETLAMVDYDNAAAAGGIGWSSLDVARLAVPATITSWSHPRFTPQVSRLLASWRLEEAVRGGQLQGAARGKDGTLELVQEGRYGYEQYGAKSLFLLGLDVSRAIRYDVGVEVMDVGGQRIAFDARLPAAHGGTHNAVLSEPYLLEAIELGLDSTTGPLAEAVYLAQERRFRATGTLTAVSEDNVDRPPYFVYYSVLNDRQPWAAFSPDGKDASAHRALSLKAAMGWSYVFEDAYSDQLRREVSTLFDPERGWYSGRYEADGTPNRAITANTNGIVLEALWYRARGPLMNAARVR